MIGTLVNSAAIIAGSLVGLLLKKGISEKYQDGINKALGLAVIIVGMNGVISNMFTSDGGKISSQGELLLIISLALGTFTGILLKIDDRLNKLSEFIEKKMNVNGFSLGFANATMIFCVGAMAVVGAINDGLSGDHSVLFIKSTLDGISSIILASTMGVGVAFSSLSVLIYQGAISLASGYIGNFITGVVLTEVSMVGNAIIMAIGVTFLKKDMFKPANMLPAIFVPVIYELLKMLYEKII